MGLIEELIYVYKIMSSSTIAYVLLLSLIASMITSFTISTACELYNSLTYTIMPTKKNMLVIYSGSALTPYTGLIPRSIEYNLSLIPGVKKIWAEVLVPVIVRNKPVILRGIEEPILCSMINEPSICTNNTLTIPFPAWIGSTAATYLGVREGDEIVVIPLFTDIPVKLRVNKIVSMELPYNGEIIVPLELAQKLRCIHKGLVSLIRVEYDPNKVDPDKIISSLGLRTVKELEKPIPVYVAEKIIIGLTNRPGNAIIASTSEYSDIYLKRLGFSKDLLFILSIILIMLLSYIIFILGKTCIILHSDKLRIIVLLGVKEMKIKLLFMMALLPLEILVFITGLLLANIISSTYSFFVFGYKLIPSVNSLIASIQLLVFTLLFMYGVLSSEIGLK